MAQIKSITKDGKEVNYHFENDSLFNMRDIIIPPDGGFITPEGFKNEPIRLRWKEDKEIPKYICKNIKQ